MYEVFYFLTFLSVISINSKLINMKKIKLFLFKVEKKFFISERMKNSDTLLMFFVPSRIFKFLIFFLKF